MIEILPLEKADAERIVAWNAGTSADFLVQWTGRGYEYPLTADQITSRIDAQSSCDYLLYKIVLNNEMIGTIELMAIDKAAKRARIGRFLLDPALAGKGYGTAALKAFVRKAQDALGIEKLSLSVFDYNHAAIRCYEKAGFQSVGREARGNGLVAISMEIA